MIYFLDSLGVIKLKIPEDVQLLGDKCFKTHGRDDVIIRLTSTLNQQRKKLIPISLAIFLFSSLGPPLYGSRWE